MKEDSDHTNLGIGAVERSEADVTRQLNHRLSERVQVEGAVLAVTCAQLTTYRAKKTSVSQLMDQHKSLLNNIIHTYLFASDGECARCAVAHEHTITASAYEHP